MNINDFAQTLLLGDSLEAKLISSLDVVDKQSTTPWRLKVDQPGRPSSLSFTAKNSRRSFPSLRELEQPTERGIVLHFFANHELLAIEVMALALLRFPEAPQAFKRGLLQTITEEQSHLQSYIRRMGELGVQLGDVPVNRFFWDCLKDMQEPLDFVLGMSLTFEQANLDFSQHYQQVFASLGDSETAAILQEVYEDEIGHVKHGVAWLERWKKPEESQWQAFAKNLRIPLSPARAKGPIFDREARRRANLSDEFCEELYVYAGTKGRPPSLYLYNADCELELSRESPGYNPNQGMRKIMSEMMSCLMFVSKPGDVVLTMRPPSLGYLKEMRELGFELPEFQQVPEGAAALKALVDSRRWDKLYPWGWTPRSLEFAQAFQKVEDLPIGIDPNGFWRSPWMKLFRKSALPKLRQELREQIETGDAASLWGPPEADGVLVADLTDVLVTIGHYNTAFGTPAVIKSPYGFAGSGMLRAYPGQDLSESQIAWIERQLDLYGSVVIEPWLKRVCDLSVVWSGDSPQLSSFLFYTNAKGQYKGHSLQTISYALPPEQRAFMFGTKQGPISAYEQLLRVAEQVRQRLQALGYNYAAGIDTMLYQWQGSWHLRVLGEINCRMTMGHVARGLRRRVNTGAVSLWQSVNAIEAKARGWATLAAMAEDLHRLHPPLHKQGAIESGVFFTNDPAHSNYVLGLVAVGAAAVKACEGLGDLGASTRTPV